MGEIIYIQYACKKIKVKGQLVKKLSVNGRTDTTDRSTCPANAVGCDKMEKAQPRLRPLALVIKRSSDC